MIDEAVVLAAGFGSRICSVMGCCCKQELRIHGLELIMYPIISLFRAGIRRFTVVVNPINYHVIDRILGEYSVKLGFKYSLELNPYRDALNGNSTLIGLKKIDSPVILSVSDHIYPPQMPNELLKCSSLDADIIALVDKQPLLIDIGEATKVKVNHDRVIEVSKEIVDPDYIDTGLFLVKKPSRITSLFNILKPVKLAEIVSDHRLDVKVCVIEGIVWKDIDVVEDLWYVYGSVLKNVVNDTIDYLVGRVKD